MSIQSEIARLETAKAAIAAAIAEKGVTVPDGTMLDGMASLIAGIEAGGGGSGEQSFSYATGTFTPDANSTQVTITHNLGRVPSFVFVFYNGTYSLTSNFNNRFISSLFCIPGKQLMTRTWNSNYMIREYSLTSFTETDAPIREANETTVKLWDSTQDDFYGGGCEYEWIIF